MLCTGKKPFTEKSKDFKFARYFDARKLPTVPNSFGHNKLVKDWQMLGNDVAGNCVIAAALHMLKLWNATAAREFITDTEDALGIYSVFTGYRPGRPETDNGTNMREFLEFWRTVGLPDKVGKLHKITAYILLEPGNLEHLYAALYLFYGVYCGFAFPASAMAQFERGDPWHVNRKDPKPREGHCVNLVRKDLGMLGGVTWAKEQDITMPWYKKYNDESWIVLSEDTLVDGCNLEGFNLDDLRADLALLKR